MEVYTWEVPQCRYIPPSYTAKKIINFQITKEFVFEENKTYSKNEFSSFLSFKKSNIFWIMIYSQQVIINVDYKITKFFKIY